MWSTCNVSFWPWQLSTSTTPQEIYSIHGKQGGSFKGWLSWAPSRFPDLSALDTPEHGGRVRPAHMALLGWQHRCPAGLGLCQPPRLCGALVATSSQEEWAVHLPTSGNKQSRSHQISAHIPGTRLLYLLPHTKLHTDTKATAKRQLVRDALIYVTPNTGRSKLGGGGKDVTVAAFQ